MASVLTGGEADDSTTGIELIEDTYASIDRFTGDGAYDGRPVHRAVKEAGAPGVKLRQIQNRIRRRGRSETRLFR